MNVIKEHNKPPKFEYQHNTQIGYKELAVFAGCLLFSGGIAYYLCGRSA